jgi:hypothetical protein
LINIKKVLLEESVIISCIVSKSIIHQLLFLSEYLKNPNKKEFQMPFEHLKESI